MKEMTPDEYRALLKQTRSEQPVVTAEEARRQYQEIHGERIIVDSEFEENPRRGWFLIIAIALVILCVFIFLLALYR